MNLVYKQPNKTVGDLNMRYMYHATPFNNLENIMDNGINTGADGLVYLCEKPEDSVKFLAIRGYRDILVDKVKIPKKLENTIIETFDHSNKFFQCRAFAQTISIPVTRIAGYIRYEL